MPSKTPEADFKRYEKFIDELHDDNLRIIDRLDSIIKLLEEMKEQEYDYWETWKRTKLKVELENAK